jgi:serine/threonine protein phosphatase PrpC
MTTDPATTQPVALVCPSCSGHVTADERFCEGCGADLGRPAPVGLAPMAEPAATAPEARTCHQCGGEIAGDGYCTQCGTLAPRWRDHFTEQPAPWVAAVCDRGIRHHRNEDAVALAAAPDPAGRAVLVVCDGVSSSTDSDVASLAAARAARDVLAASRPRGVGTATSHVAATARALSSAADAANEAVIATTRPGGGNPASCTFVAAVVDGPLLVAGWVGDSRAYWLPDTGNPVLLTTDDSFAAEQIAAGVDRAVAETGPHAHAITRWLGSDAPDHTPRTVSVDLPVPGWVLVCSDGLWNYCSAATDVAALLGSTIEAVGAAPLPLASALVDWANGQGGRDNITVALARTDPTPAASDPLTAHREEVRPDGNVLS